MGKSIGIATYLRWLAKLLLGLWGARDSGFVHLSPPTANKQTILDRQTKRLINVRVRNRIDLRTMQQVFEDEDYRLERFPRSDDIRRLYNTLLENRMTPLIIDCGANIGLASSYFLLRFPMAKIVAIEPDENNLALARENCSSERVEFIHAGVASHCGKGSIIDPGRGNNAFRTESNDDGTLSLLSIQEILKRFDKTSVVPFIIKIDIEGFEDNLFSTSTEWVDSFPVLIIELHDWMFPGAGKSSPFLQVISTKPRDFFFAHENVFSIAHCLKVTMPFST